MESIQNNSPIIVQYIKDRIENRNKNFLMLFVGATGSGKSYASLKLAEVLDPTFKIDRVCFRAKQFMEKINELVEKSKRGEKIAGVVIIWDELGVEHSSREFMTISNRVINYFFQTSRHLNLIVLMTVPLYSFVDSATRKLCHCVAEMVGINTSRGKSTAKVKLIQTNVMTGKEYPKYLRYRKGNKQYVSKRLSFSMPSKELRDSYEDKKQRFTTQLNKEIMSKLEIQENKDKQIRKPMTPIQEEIATLLTKNSMEEVSKLKNVNLSSVYSHKNNIEKKGYHFIPVWRDKHIIRWNIEGFVSNSYVKDNEAHF